MEIYKNLSGKSEVYAYQIGADFIVIKFISNQVYSYSYQKAGKAHVEQMKILAENGIGLNSYINKKLKKLND